VCPLFEIGLGLRARRALPLSAAPLSGCELELQARPGRRASALLSSAPGRSPPAQPESRLYPRLSSATKPALPPPRGLLASRPVSSGSAPERPPPRAADLCPSPLSASDRSQLPPSAAQPSRERSALSRHQSRVQEAGEGQRHGAGGSSCRHIPGSARIRLRYPKSRRHARWSSSSCRSAPAPPSPAS
jgi:hypothetical protein